MSPCSGASKKVASIYKHIYIYIYICMYDSFTRLIDCVTFTTRDSNDLVFSTRCVHVSRLCFCVQRPGVSLQEQPKVANITRYA